MGFRSHSHWSDGDDLQLLTLCAAKFHVREIALALGRSEASISQRLASFPGREDGSPGRARATTRMDLR